MDWVDGLNLRQWLATKPRRRERLKVLRQLVDAIEFMHSRQVVHRDLKPENVMITRNGHNVKLIDFGLADTDSYSDFKQPSGTKGYVSPEQRVERTTDCRNDIYSLGCIITDLHLGHFYNALAQRCKAPLKQRLPSIVALRQLRKRKQRITVPRLPPWQPYCWHWPAGECTCRRRTTDGHASNRWYSSKWPT